MGKIRLLHMCNQLDLGGTEKALQIFCKYLDKSRFEVFACGWLRGGVRVRELEKLGIPVILNPGDIDALVRELKVDICHVYRSGHFEAASLPRKVNGSPRIVETNIFGDCDYVEGASIDCHVFISEFLRNQYLAKHGRRPGAEHEVLYMPVDFEECADVAKAFDYTIGRCSRPDDQKWHDVCVDSLPKIFQKVPQTRCLFQGATDKVKARLIGLGLSGRVELLEPSVRVEDFYRRIDLFTHGSRIGETFGCVIAEAMAHRIPVITLSTPQRKKANAQVELVEHNVTGFVCTSTRQYADAVIELLENHELWTQFAQRGYDKARAQFGATHLTHKLEDLYINLMDRRSQPVESVSELFRSSNHPRSRMPALISFFPTAAEFLLRHPTKLGQLRQRWRDYVGRYGRRAH